MDDDERSTLGTRCEFRIDVVPVRAAVVVEHEPADAMHAVVPGAPVVQPLQFVVLLQGGQGQRNVGHGHRPRQTDPNVELEFGEPDPQVDARAVRGANTGLAHDAEDGRAPRTPPQFFDNEPSAPAEKPDAARVPQVEERWADTDHLVGAGDAEDIVEDRRPVTSRAHLVADLEPGERPLHVHAGRYANRLWGVFRKDSRHCGLLIDPGCFVVPERPPASRVAGALPRGSALPGRLGRQPFRPTRNASRTVRFSESGRRPRRRRP